MLNLWQKMMIFNLFFGISIIIIGGSVGLFLLYLIFCIYDLFKEQYILWWVKNSKKTILPLDTK